MISAECLKCPSDAQKTHPLISDLFTPDLQVDEKPDKAELGLPRPHAQPPVTSPRPLSDVSSHAPGLSPVEKKPWLMVPTPILPPLPTLNFSVCQVRSQEK